MTGEVINDYYISIVRLTVEQLLVSTPFIDVTYFYVLTIEFFKITILNNGEQNYLEPKIPKNEQFQKVLHEVVLLTTIQMHRMPLNYFQLRASLYLTFNLSMIFLTVDLLF